MQETKEIRARSGRAWNPVTGFQNRIGADLGSMFWGDLVRTIQQIAFQHFNHFTRLCSTHVLHGRTFGDQMACTQLNA